MRLSGHTSLGIGGAVETFFTPGSVAELREDLHWLRQEGVPFRVLGGGTNVACRDGKLPGALISTSRMDRAYHYGRCLRVRAGCQLVPLVRRCCEWGLSGMEPLAGIPGSLGGAVVMNAGGRYGNIGSLIHEVRTLTLEGEERVYPGPADRFTYRRGDFDGEIVTEAVLILTPSQSARVKERTHRILREKVVTQPLSARSAGCVFRNPPGGSAGRLIDACGLKGRRIGGVLVSPVHANFFVNTGEGKFADFMALVKLTGARVREKFGIELELEVKVFR